MSTAYGNRPIVSDGLFICVDPATYSGSGTQINQLIPEVPPEEVTLTGQGFEYVSENSVSTLGFVGAGSTSKGASDPAGLGCSGNVTFQQAVELAHSIGARLPTVTEVIEGVAQGTGCGYDNTLIWTCDAANAEGTQHYVMYGRLDNKPFLQQLPLALDVNSTATMRYAADIDPSRSDPNIVISNTMKTILENYYSTTYSTTLQSKTFLTQEPLSDVRLINGTQVQNGAFVFDGVDDRVSLNKTYFFSNKSLDLGEVSYSMESWIYLTSTPVGDDQSGFAIMGHADGEGIGIQVVLQSEVIKVNFGLRSTNNYDSVSSLELNTWYHIVCVRDDSTQTAYFYINGVLDSAQSVGSNLRILSSDSEFQIGDATSRLRGFTGSIGPCRVYKKALTAQEVQQNFNAMRGRYGI